MIIENETPSSSDVTSRLLFAFRTRLSLASAAWPDAMVASMNSCEYKKDGALLKLEMRLGRAVTVAYKYEKSVGG